MKPIKSFIYLDNQKMYSISSQLFEGLTEQIVSLETKKEIESTTQKGNFGTGRLMADIIESDKSKTETKFLHDFSYNLFEEALFNQDRVLQITSQNIDEAMKKINNFSFVKISGNIIFNDLKTIETTIKNFNNIGEALGYIIHKSDFDREIEALKSQIKNEVTQKDKAKANALLKSQMDLKKYLKTVGLQYDEKYLQHMGYVLDYGYNQQFEVQLPIKSTNEFCLFSAQLKRENLKEDEYTIIKKYSRETEKQFQLFGIITQKLDQTSKQAIFEEFKNTRNDIEKPNAKEALMNMAAILTGIEGTFTGKLDYEYIIDPIALYLEI